jgi:hypothetical protein
MSALILPLALDKQRGGLLQTWELGPKLGSRGKRSFDLLQATEADDGLPVPGDDHLFSSGDLGHELAQMGFGIRQADCTHSSLQIGHESSQIILWRMTISKHDQQTQ